MRQSVELALAALIIIKPEGWKGTGVTTYWKDSDGIKPGVAGCHVEVTKGGKSFTGRRVFGEACLDGLLVESNPGRIT
jgi:hypothetical protein